MSQCCGSQKDANKPDVASSAGPLEWFAGMLDHCHEYARAAKSAGQPVVGILCEFTPRELIMAAGGVPVCLCGGSAKTIPAAEEHLPANLCPLIKSTYGYHVLRSNPFLEMADLVVGETTCDGKKKMYELMGQTRPMYVLELPQKPDDPDAAASIGMPNCRSSATFLRRPLRRPRSRDERLREAIAVMNRERRAAPRAGRVDAGRRAAAHRPATARA